MRTPYFELATGSFVSFFLLHHNSVKDDKGEVTWKITWRNPEEGRGNLYLPLCSFEYGAVGKIHHWEFLRRTSNDKRNGNTPKFHRPMKARQKTNSSHRKITVKITFIKCLCLFSFVLGVLQQKSDQSTIRLFNQSLALIEYFHSHPPKATCAFSAFFFVRKTLSDPLS